MCQIIRVATLQHETFEVLEEQAIDRVISQSLANDFEQTWEAEAEEYADLEIAEVAWS